MRIYIGTHPLVEISVILLCVYITALLKYYIESQTLVNICTGAQTDFGKACVLVL